MVTNFSGAYDLIQTFAPCYNLPVIYTQIPCFTKVLVKTQAMIKIAGDCLKFRIGGQPPLSSKITSLSVISS
jgi:hypothetical protein